VQVEEAPSLRVRRLMGEKAIKVLDGLKLRRRDLKIRDANNRISIPLIRPPTKSEKGTIQNEIGEYDLIEDSFTRRARRVHTLVEALSERLPPHLLASLPRAVDIVGDVAVVEIPGELNGSKQLIGAAIMTINKNVHTVLAKAGPVSTPLRVREFDVIAGRGVTETTHREQNLSFRLDVSKIYFSPRLAFEHNRVASLVRNGEVVVDMFTGVGPFAIQVAATQRQATVYAIDINPEAVRYLLQNTRINRVRGKVTAILGESRLIITTHLSGVADRVIMNLPGEAGEYLSAACRALKADGGVLHFYTFSDEPDLDEGMLERFASAVMEAGRRVLETEVRAVKSTAPHQWQVVVDAKIA
jgi:tRNA (guanine37-N1)-methyltransferase